VISYRLAIAVGRVWGERVYSVSQPAAAPSAETSFTRPASPG